MLADVFDGGQSGGPYALAVAEARRRVAEPESTPSGRFLRTLENRRLGFSAYVLELAREHALRHRAGTYSEPGREAFFEETRRRSLEEQERLEKSGESLEAYLARYLA
jgi:glutamate--cysteine ligase